MMQAFFLGKNMSIKLKTEAYDNRRFFKLLFTLAFPIVLQNLLHSSLTLLDILMIGQLNEASIAAVGIANQFAFIFLVVQFGVHSGISIFTAQHWGKKDYKSIKNLVGIGLILGLLISLLFTYVAIFIPEILLSLFTKDTVVINLATNYLRIIGISFPITVVTLTYTFNLRSTEIVKMPLYASTIAVFLNIFLNYILIFGKFGFPALGVTGAAIATSISRVVEGLFLVSAVYIKKYPAAATFKEMIGFDLSYIKNMLGTCWPVLLNEIFWVTGVSLYNLVYARIGTGSIAAVNIVASVENFAMIPFFGVFSAGSIIVGNLIGAGDEKEAYRISKRLLIVQFVMATVTGGLMIASRGTILSFYNISDIAFKNAYNLMLVVGVVLWVKATNYTLIVSIFRGGGDTRFGLLLDVCGVWLIGVPMAFTGAFYFSLPVYYVMTMVVTEEIVKLSFAVPRFFSKKWIRNVVKE